jgi:3-deoxy-D-manno-octulosonic acid (KDO) 8-phosphate synthase
MIEAEPFFVFAGIFVFDLLAIGHFVCRALLNAFHTHTHMHTGPCVIEGEEHAMMMSQRLQEIGKNVGIPLMYVVESLARQTRSQFT